MCIFGLWIISQSEKQFYTETRSFWILHCVWFTNCLHFASVESERGPCGPNGRKIRHTPSSYFSLCKSTLHEFSPGWKQERKETASSISVRFVLLLLPPSHSDRLIIPHSSLLLLPPSPPSRLIIPHSSSPPSLLRCRKPCDNSH